MSKSLSSTYQDYGELEIIEGCEEIHCIPSIFSTEKQHEPDFYGQMCLLEVCTIYFSRYLLLMIRSPVDALRLNK